MNNQIDSRSPLAKAKGSGASHSGTSVWWLQRLTALALFPLVFWFAYFMLQVTKFSESADLMTLFVSPFNTIFLAVFISIGIYHGNLGIKEIIEDYVHTINLKYFLIISFNILSLVTVFAMLCALIVFHLSTFNYN